MNLHLGGSSILFAVGLSLVLSGCSSGSADNDGLDGGGAGGGSGTGGLAGTGGTPGSGGVKGSGGNSGSGGVTGSGGNHGSGGTASSGGAPGSGGDNGSGGAQGSGGSNGPGGTSASTGGRGAGGRRGSGGVKGSGGAPGSGGMKGSGGNTGSGGGAGASFADVLAIFQDRCVSCHDATKLGLPSYPQLSLTTNDAYDALVGHPADETCGGARVVAGDPNASYLIQKVTVATPCEGAHMPAKFEVLPAVPLTAAQIATLRSWIAAGAQP